MRDVLVWSHGIFMFRTALVPVDQCCNERRAHTSEVKRLGDAPVVVELCSEDATIEVAARAEHRSEVTGPYVS